MADITDPSSMQIIASTPTQQLLYDSFNSQSFYLYTISTKVLTSVTGSAARSFYDAAPNQSTGITSWGYTQVEPALLGKNNTN